MAKGYIYIMTNPALKGMVKIGYATDVELRRQQLSTTALPYDYEIYATYETPGKLEDKKLHKLIDKLNPDLRVSKNREFFIMSPEDAYELLESIAIISGSVDKLKRTDDPSSDIYMQRKQTVKKPAINFAECGIPVGAELVCTEDDSIRPVVVDERKVRYRDEITSLSAIMEEVKKTKHIAGPSYFTFNGEPIVDIANRTQWKDWT